MYCSCSENKDADQLRSYAPLFSHRQKSVFFHDAALLMAARFGLKRNFFSLQNLTQMKMHQLTNYFILLFYPFLTGTMFTDQQIMQNILSLTLIFLTLTLTIGVEQTENDSIHIITGREMENKGQHAQCLAMGGDETLFVHFQKVVKQLRTGFDDANDWYSLYQGVVDEEFINFSDIESLYDSGKLNISQLYSTVSLIRLYEILISVVDVTV